MTPERASALFRELLQTPPSELDQFARRNGLSGHPDRGSLEQAQELLRALSMALQSGPGPNWLRVSDAWGAMISKHGKIDVLAMGPAPPGWIRDMPSKPTLGDPAPGGVAQQQQAQQRQRFVPSAQPQFVPPPPPPAPPAAMPTAPMPAPAPAAPAAPWPRTSRGSYPPPPIPQNQLAAQQNWPAQQAPQQGYAAPAAPYPGAPQAHYAAPSQAAPPQAAYPQAQTPQAHAQYPAAAQAPVAQAPAAQAPVAQAPAAQAPVAQAQAPYPQQAAYQGGAYAQAAAPVPAAPPPLRRPPPPPRRQQQQSVPPAAPSGPNPRRQALDSNVSTYAAFCAACAAYPERAAQTHTEYGIVDEADRRSVDGAWADRFDDDEDLHAKWEQLFSQFRGQIKRQ